MLVNDEGQGTEQDTSTLEFAAQGFEDYLSSQDEDPVAPETQPTQEQAPASESDEAEEGSEPSEAEDATAETDDESEEQTEEPAWDGTAKVRLPDGEEVTLDDLHKGRLRQADYTRKTQELAAQRKTQEAEFTAVRGERAKYAELMTQVEQALKDITGEEPDWAQVQAERPEEFPALYSQWQIRQRELEAISGERQRAQEAVQRDQMSQRQTYLEAERDALVAALPEWKDAEKAKTERASIVAYAERAGFSREELTQVVDHRAILMLRKAMLYDKAQAAKPAIVKRIEKVRTATPGPTPASKKPVTEGTRAKQRLAKTGSLHDAADAFNLLFD